MRKDDICMIQSFKTFQSEWCYNSFEEAYEALKNAAKDYHLYKMFFVENSHGDWRYEASGWREGFNEEKE